MEHHSSVFQYAQNSSHFSPALSVGNPSDNARDRFDEKLYTTIEATASDGYDHDAVGTSSKKSKGGKKSRKPKYAFQTRSQVDILDDGYRWRKYGQKAVKNNRFPRSYYRCTHQNCSVKKQVQRLSKDEGIVVTTYEGMHSHPIDKPTENFEHILNQMQIYNSEHFSFSS